MIPLKNIFLKLFISGKDNVKGESTIGDMQ